MPALEIDALTAAMVGFMRGVAGAGTVHDRPRSASRPDQYARLCAYEGSYRGWIVRYHFSTERQGGEIGSVTLSHRFALTWVLPYDDDRTDGETSTAEHARMFAAMAAQFRQYRSFGFGRARVENQLLQGQAPAAPVEVSETKGLMHVGNATLEVLESVVGVVGC